MNIILVGAIIGIGGIFQLLIGIILGTIFIILPKRKEILAVLGSGFIVVGIVQVIFGTLFWVVNLYVN